MDKSTYAQLFDEAVRRALELAHLDPATTEPVVEFHGKPNPAQPITIDEALDLLWLSSERFYRIVDVAAFVGENDPPTLFVRLSGHEPSVYSDTWDPSDLGPFKAIGPATRSRG